MDWHLVKLKIETREDGFREYVGPSIKGNSLPIIDVRNLGQQSTYNNGLNDGWVQCLAPVGWNPRGWDHMFIGTGRPDQIAIPNNVKREMNNILGGTQTIESDFLLDAFREMLIYKANDDVTAMDNGPNPIMPDHRNQMKLAFGGRSYNERLDLKNATKSSKILSIYQSIYRENKKRSNEGKLEAVKYIRWLDYHRKKLGITRDEAATLIAKENIGKWHDAETTVTDDFQGFSAFDTMDSSANWTKFSGSGNFQAINAAGAISMQRASNSGEAYHIHQTILSGDDMYCQVESLSRSGSQIVLKPMVRCDGNTSTLTTYFCDIGSNGANDVAFRKVVSGTSTKLSSKNMSVPSANTSYVEIDGSSYDVQIDSSSELSGTDTAITSGLYHGIGSWGNGSNSINFDNYEAADIGGGGGGSSSSTTSSSSSSEESSSSSYDTSDQPPDGPIEAYEPLEFYFRNRAKPEESTSTSSISTGDMMWHRLDTNLFPISELKVRKSYDHPDEMEFIMHCSQQDTPIPQRYEIVMVDPNGVHGDGLLVSLARPIFEGHVHEIQPYESNKVKYYCYDPTRMAAQEIILEDPLTGIPRVVYNSSINIAEDDDAAFEFRSNANVGRIVRDILEFHNDELRLMMASPDPEIGALAYRPQDIASWSYRPQEKIVLQNETIRSAVTRMLKYYPAFRMYWLPGYAYRKWRFFNVLEAEQVTLTLNDFTGGRKVLTMQLEQSLEDRATAVKMEGPPTRVLDTASVSDLSLEEMWTQTQENNLLNVGPNAPIETIKEACRRWRIADEDKRRIAKWFPTEYYVPSITIGGVNVMFRPIRQPILMVTWDNGVSWELIPDVIIEYGNGIVRTPYRVIKDLESATPPKFRKPDDVKFIFAYYDPNSTLSVRYPETGFEGTAYDDHGLEFEREIYEEHLATHWQYGNPQTTEQRTVEFAKIAETIHAGSKDTIWTGGCTIEGLDYEWSYLNRRVNFAAVDPAGESLTTGWEDINAILTDVEYDYENRLTTLAFSGDMQDYFESDVGALVSRLTRQTFLNAVANYTLIIQTGGLTVATIGGSAGTVVLPSAVTGR